MFASLPMYAAPQAEAAHAALWAGVRDRLRAAGQEAPETLDQHMAPMEGWGRANLVLGQICNMPWRALFRDRVTLVGTADYALDGAEPGYYHSVLVVRRDDPARTLADCGGHRFALNDVLSNSGWDLPQAAARAAGIALRPHLVTGAHRASLAAVAGGRADLASLDAITWERVLATDPNREAVRVLGRTATSPGMIFITAKGRDPAPVRAALEAAIPALSPRDREVLGLRGVVDLPPAAYDIPLPPPPRFG